MAGLSYMDGFYLPELDALRKIQQQLTELYPPSIWKPLSDQAAMLNAYHMTALSAEMVPARWQETVQHLNELTSKFTPIMQEFKQYHRWFHDVMQSIDYQICDVAAFHFDDIKAKGFPEKHKLASELTSFAKEIETIELPKENYAESSHGVDFETKQLITDEIEDALSDKRNWQQKLFEKAIKYQTTNPVITWFIQQIVVALIVGIISGLITNAIGHAKSGTKVRESPNTNAQVICTIDKDQNVTITGDAPYYYEVEIESGDEITTLKGFVSKKSVMKLSADDTHENE